MSKQGREMHAQAAAQKTPTPPPVPSSMTGAKAKEIVDDAVNTQPTPSIPSDMTGDKAKTPTPPPAPSDMTGAKTKTPTPLPVPSDITGAKAKTPTPPPVPSDMTGDKARETVDNAGSKLSELNIIKSVYSRIDTLITKEAKTIGKAITSATERKNVDCTNNSSPKCGIATKTLTILKNAKNKNIDTKTLKDDLSAIHDKAITVEKALIEGIQNANTDACKDYSVQNISLQCKHAIMQIKGDVLEADTIITQFNTGDVLKTDTIITQFNTEL